MLENFVLENLELNHGKAAAFLVLIVVIEVVEMRLNAFNFDSSNRPYSISSYDAKHPVSASQMCLPRLAQIRVYRVFGLTFILD